MRLEVYFDYSSPFAYLGLTQVERIARAHEAVLEYRPMLLGGLFRSIGTPLVPIHAMSEPKRRYQMLEMHRWAEHWGVPLHFPSRFPLRTVDALRLTLLAPERARGTLIAALMRAAWVDDEDPSDPAVLGRAAEAAQLSPSLVDRVGEPAVKEALRERTEEAAQRGVPGAPTFFVDDLMFWGQDRLGFVERALGGWRPRCG
jgi:2-hydroxychromene-2-carboxylate isomerase